MQTRGRSDIIFDTYLHRVFKSSQDIYMRESGIRLQIVVQERYISTPPSWNLRTCASNSASWKIEALGILAASSILRISGRRRFAWGSPLSFDVCLRRVLKCIQLLFGSDGLNMESWQTDFVVRKSRNFIFPAKDLIHLSLLCGSVVELFLELSLSVLFEFTDFPMRKRLQ